MAVGVELKQRPELRTELRLTPELKTAIELLQLPQIELEQRIEQEIEENPLLEWEEKLAELPKAAYERHGRIEGTNFARTTEGPDFDPFQRFVADEPGLHGHLEWQIGVHPWDESDKSICYDLVPRIAPDGYLRESDADLAAELDVSEGAIATARRLLQSLEPTGVAARDLAECLTLQLAELRNEADELEIADREDGRAELAAAILADHCDALESGNLTHIADALDVELEEIQSALQLLSTLDPKPGAHFRDDTSDPVVPEIVIEPRSIPAPDDEKPELPQRSAGESPLDRWHVHPYQPHTRRVRRSDVMVRFQEEPESFSRREQQFLREKIRRAEYFLNSLKQRELTLTRVTEAIVQRQEAMLYDGPEAAGPLTLKEIANEVDLHESTVSRVTRRKYAITPRGIVELKSFFRQSVDGVHTPLAVQTKIRELIEQENPQKPLSDQAISDRLKEAGVDIARRTVAKYRMEMDFPSRSDRKRSYASGGSPS